MRTVTASDAQLKLEERTGLGINRAYLADKPEKIRVKKQASLHRPENLVRATKAIKAYTQSGEFDAGWELFKATTGADDVLCNAALNLCAKALRKDRAWQLWTEMAQESKSIVSYNTMLDLCKRCKDPIQAEQLFVEMKARSIEPSIITYNALISALAMASVPEKAFEQFKSMPPELLAGASVGNQQVAYQVAMIALARAGDYPRTREVFTDMIAAGTPPDNAHFNALMTACAANGSTYADIAQQIFNSMIAYKVVADTANWTILLSCHRHNLTRCKEIIAEMKQSDVEPSGLTYQELLEAHVLAKDGPGAKLIADNLKQLGKWGHGSKVTRLLKQVEGL